VKNIVALVLLFVIGCGAATPVIQYPAMAEKQRVEEKELPAPPDAEPIAPEDDWTKAMKPGDSTDKAGVLLSPGKAARAKKWQDGYLNLRSLYELDRKIWQQHRIVYEERISSANAEIKRLSPSWWDENKGTLGWAGGFLMGAAATIAIVYGLDNVRQ
jgi:hypothetical protein